MFLDLEFFLPCLLRVRQLFLREQKNLGSNFFGTRISLDQKLIFHLFKNASWGGFQKKLQRSYSTKGRLPSKVVFRQRLSSVKGCLPSKVIFHQRSSSVKSHLSINKGWCKKNLTKLATQFLLNLSG